MLRPSPIALLLVRDHLNPGALARDKSLLPLRRGVYVERGPWERLPAWDRYLVRVHAVALTWKNPTFCLESAAVLDGLPVFDEPRHIHVLGETARRSGDVLVHGASDLRATTAEGGILRTDLMDTAVDLGRVLQPAQALAVADAALRRLGRPFDFAAFGEAQNNRRGIRQLRWVQQHARDASESVGETFSRAVIEWLGYEDPELQRELWTEGYRDRVDFVWRAEGVLGESDGYGKYDASDPAGMKAHFVREKKREDRLRRRPDVRGFARWDWSDTIRFEPLDHALRAAGLRPVRPRRLALLRTLATNPRAIDRRDVPVAPRHARDEWVSAR